MTNEFEKNITNDEISDIDSIAESSGLITNSTNNDSKISDKLVVDDDSGIIDLKSSDFEDIGTYKPSLESADKKRINDIINENLSYIASKDNGVFAKKRQAIIDEIEEYKKNLIINKGFTDEEAAAAAEKRAEKRSLEEVNDYKTNNPEVAIIKVNKTDSDKLEIDPEDKPKVHKATSIRLIEVEDADLKHLKMKKYDTKTPINIAKLNTCTLTRFMVPCINTVDMCTFAGTSTYNLVNLYFSENDSFRTRLSKQMDLVYDKFVSSTTKEKYTKSGVLAMTKEDFLNWFAFADLTAAMYAIYVASSTEMITSKFDCQNDTCKDAVDGKTVQHSFDYTYNCKEIMTFKNITDTFKPTYERILESNNNFDKMSALRDEINVGHRYKSSITNNIYDIETPSCARALEFADFVKTDDTQLSDVYFGIAIHIARIYLYCGDDEEGDPTYMEVTDPETIFNIVSDAIEPEFDLYTKKLVANKTYSYETSITYVCDKCGNEVTSPIDMASLVFLKAQRAGSEIE
jgi:hypothetical protein